MNAGLSNLETLKKHLLADTMAGTKQFDAVILAIGLGAAGMLEQYCQRKFALMQRAESFGADRVQFILSHTPLLTVDKTEFKQDETTGFVTQAASYIRTIDFDNGVIFLPEGSDAGDYWSLVRFTYTGGYFWEMLEPDNEVYPSQITAGATALPEDLRLAWFLQCESLWSKRDKLGVGITDKPDEQAKLDEIKLLPLVKQLLANYVKVNLV